MSEWIELPTLQDVAKAQADGWETEVRYYSADHWVSWSMESWNDLHQYRGRPRQPKTKKVVLRVPVFKEESRVWTGVPRSDEVECTAYLDELPHRWEGGKLIVEVPE